MIQVKKPINLHNKEPTKREATEGGGGEGVKIQRKLQEITPYLPIPKNYI